MGYNEMQLQELYYGYTGKDEAWHNKFFFDNGQRILTTLGLSKSAAEQIANSLFCLYGIQGKYYHTIVHINQMFRMAKTLKWQLKLSEQLAILFHDIVYVAGFKQNEEFSAVLMNTMLAPYFDQDEVARAIYSKAAVIVRETKFFFEDLKLRPTSPNSKDSFRVLDLDLISLGKPWHEFFNQNLLIGAEFPNVPNDRRATFLENFLTCTRGGRQSVFYSRELKKYDKVARENLTRYIAFLRKPLPRVSTPGR